MASALFEKGREGFLDADIDWSADTIKAVLLDLATSDTGIKQITGATNATPIVVTVTSHGWTNGDVVIVQGVLGNTAANGKWAIANQATNTFELATSVGNGAYTSGGSVVNMTVADNLDDIDGAIVGSAVTLGTKTSTYGVADAADITFSAVSGATVEAVALYKDSGVAATSRLIALIVDATGLPVTPNGGDITISWSNGTSKIFKL